jgi:hypothetical protein
MVKNIGMRKNVKIAFHIHLWQQVYYLPIKMLNMLAFVLVVLMPI